MTDEQKKFADDAAATRDAKPNFGYGSISLPFDVLKDLLGMPLNMGIASIHLDQTRRVLLLTVVSPDLPYVEEGDQTPDVQVLSTIRIIRVDPSFVVKAKEE